MSYDDVPLFYSSKQMRLMEALYYLSTPFSLMGSLVTIYVITSEMMHRTSSLDPHVQRTYLRLVLGYGIVDVMQSLVWLALGPWALPNDQ